MNPQLPVALFLVLGCLSSSLGATTEFGTFEDLVAAARSAQPGDTLILKAGHYEIDDAVTLAAGDGGTAGQPVNIRAESVGSVTLTGNTTAFAFKPGATHVVVSGFVFQLQNETAVKLDGANHIRVSRCEFRLHEAESFDWLVITGPNSHHNRVDHCLFADKQQTGNYVTIDGDSSGQQSQYDRIDHNLFRDIGPRATNEKEAIRVGWSEVSLSSGYTVVEFNLFDRCDGDPEIISIKSCDNTVRFNTIIDSMGVLSLRHGNRTSVHGNVILGKGRPGCGGIRIYGDDHRIYNNYLANLTGERFDAALVLTNGDKEDARPGGSLDAHYRPRRIEIVNNSLVGNAQSIELGYPHPGKKPWRKAPQEILFANNFVRGEHSDLVKVYTEPETCVWQNNAFLARGECEIGWPAAADACLAVDESMFTRVDMFLVPIDGQPATRTGREFEYVTEDVTGEPRDTSTTIGAIQAATEVKPLAPLSSADVGPMAD